MILGLAAVPSSASVAPSSDSIDLTDDSLDPRGTITIGPIKVTTTRKKTTAKAAPKSKVVVKRAGAAGSILDKILPLQQDTDGKKTIWGLPPFVIYLAGGIGLSFLGVYALRRFGGGGGRRHAVSNPKRHAPKKARRRAKR